MSALVHGGVWRAVSLSARIGFLVFVIPRTGIGEFGVFFSYSSVGLLLARVVSLGAIDHLPTQVRGDSTAMRAACRDLVPLFFVACTVTVAAGLTNSLVAAAVAVALSMASGLMLAGAVRSVSPASFERWMNLHPVLLLVAALAYGDELQATELLTLQAGSVLVSQLLLIRFAVTSVSPPPTAAFVSWVNRVRGLLEGGASRMLSDALVAACVRSIAIGPVLLGMGAVSDSLALALAFGEAIWTVGMILVHRNFAFYCSSGADLRHSVRSASLLLAGTLVAGAVGGAFVLGFSELPIFERVSAATLFASFAFFAGVTALLELRYFDLAAGKPLRMWIVGQIVFMLLAAAAPGIWGESTAIWCVAIATMLPAVVMIGSRLRIARSSS